MTVFGAPYVRLFSRDRLLATPAHKVTELSSGAISIQLTADILDCINDEGNFEKQRAAARDFLGSDAFFDPERLSSFPYRIPEFAWRPILH
jgi:hypothetical protein